MIKIRVTLKDGRKFYVSEIYPYDSDSMAENQVTISLVKDYDKGLLYHHLLEFRVAWSYNYIGIDNPNWYKETFGRRIHRIDAKDVVKFESIDNTTLKIKAFNIKNEFKIPKTLKFAPRYFNMLKDSRITCSHWLYDQKNKWIPFPKDEDYKRVKKIRYYKRGLTTIFHDGFAYRNHSLPYCYRFYESRKELLRHPLLCKIWLQREPDDSCHEFV